ncbi:MAG: glycoside hydrolase family 43 protein [Acidobacteriota bacterium]
MKPKSLIVISAVAAIVIGAAVGLLSIASGEANAQGSDYFLFTSFRGNGEDGLHLALSTDGLRWKALNEDRSYLKPTAGKGQLMRDPCLVAGPDGRFHMVWTTGWYDQTIGYASSSNLVDWSEQKAFAVLAHEPTARNAWAPEIFYDDSAREWLIFWATTIPGRFPETDHTGGSNGLNHRIYMTATRDFRVLSATSLFFDPGFNVIDATILKSDLKTGPRYFMVFKDERQVPVRKNLRLSVAGLARGPYGGISEPFTRDWVEGPTVLKVGAEWIVYFDRYREHQYGAVKSKDLKQWLDISDELSFPRDHRHGSVLRISKALAENLTRQTNGTNR